MRVAITELNFQIPYNKSATHGLKHITNIQRKMSILD